MSAILRLQFILWKKSNYLLDFSKNLAFQYDSFLITSQYTKSKHSIYKHNIEFDFDVPGKIQFPIMKSDFYVTLTNPKNKD